MTAGHKWKPLQRAVYPPASEASDAFIKIAMESFKVLTREAAIAAIEKENANTEHWINDLYQVEVRRHYSEGYVHLNIRRRDGYPGRDWRHFQQIKNELVGPEHEAVELYPAESRLTDTSNKYHLYVCLDPKYRFPFGFTTRDVVYGNENTNGLRQRPPMKFSSKSST